MLSDKLNLLLTVQLLLLGRWAAANQLDMQELDRYLARKLDIVTNLTLRQPTDVPGADRLRTGAAKIIYFGDFNSEETSTFQSSLSLLALLPRYAGAATVDSVGFVDTSALAGDQLRRRLGVVMRHSIVGWTNRRRATFHGYRNVQLLLDFVDRLLTSKPLWLTSKDRGGEAAVLLLPDGVERPTTEWTAQLAEMSVELPTYIGAGRRLANAYGAVPGSLAYRSAVTGSVAAARLRDYNGRSLCAVLRHLRSGESVMQLSARNLYLTAAEAEHWDEDGVSKGNATGRTDSKPLLILLADPESQATASVGLALMKRLVSIRRSEQQQRDPAWLAASFNPWRRFLGEPEIDWSGLLGGLQLNRGPSFLMTTNRRFGGGDLVGPGDAFYLDEFQLEALDSGDSSRHAAALAALQRWLRNRLENSETTYTEKITGGSGRVADEL